MDKDSFFNLFLEFHSKFHMVHLYLYLSVKPFCIYIESEGFNNGEMDRIFSFFNDKNIEFSYSCYYVHHGVRLILTFKVV